MFFPKSSVEVRDTWQVMGLRGTGSDSYTLNDLFVPEAYSMPRYVAMPPRVAGKLYVFTPSTLYTSSFAGIALGIARSVMEAFVSDVKDTKPRGASRTRGRSHVIQSQVAQNEARLRSARMFLLGSVSEIWESRAKIRRSDRRSVGHHPHGLNLGHSIGAGGGGSTLWRGGRSGDIQQPAVRAAVPRYTYRDATNPGSSGAFRNGGADFVGTGAGPADVHVLSGTATSPKVQTRP